LTTHEPEPLLCDVACAALAARLTDDSAILLAGVFVQHADEVAVSPELASWITGRSAASVRYAIAKGRLPAVGRTKMYVTLSDLGVWNGLPITAGAVELALGRAAWRRHHLLDWMTRADLPPFGRGPQGFADAVDALRAACTEPEELAQ